MHAKLFCQYRYRNLNACKFHLERRVEYSTGPTAGKTNVTLVRSNDFSRAGNTFPWTSASLKIILMESTYPGQRPQSPSLSPHFLLTELNKGQLHIDKKFERIYHALSMCKFYTAADCRKFYLRFFATFSLVSLDIRLINISWQVHTSLWVVPH